MKGRRHITFYVGAAPGKDKVYGLGGNQGNALKISIYNKADVNVSPRFPVKA